MLNTNCREEAPVASAIVPKGQIDLLVLRSMVQKIRVTLHSLEEPGPYKAPLMYRLSMGRHTQRIVLYRPEQLLVQTPLAFVGFVSGKQKTTAVEVDQELHRVDERLTHELISMPGLLGYSSLELRSGNWYNLVLLSDLDVKGHLKNGATHQYAAYQLAPQYYEWIRLHSGMLPAGLASNTMELQRTKYYRICDQSFIMQELTY